MRRLRQGNQVVLELQGGQGNSKLPEMYQWQAGSALREMQRQWNPDRYVPYLQGYEHQQARMSGVWSTWQLQEMRRVRSRELAGIKVIVSTHCQGRGRRLNVPRERSARDRAAGRPRADRRCSRAASCRAASGGIARRVGSGCLACDRT